MSAQKAGKVLRERGNINRDGTVTEARRAGGRGGQAGSRRNTSGPSLSGASASSVESVAVSTANVPESAKNNQVYFHCKDDTIYALSNTSVEHDAVRNSLIRCSNLNARRTKTGDTYTRLADAVRAGQHTLRSNKKWYVGVIPDGDEWAALTEDNTFWPPLAGPDNATIFAIKKAYREFLAEGESSTAKSGDGTLNGAGAGPDSMASGHRSPRCELAIHLGDNHISVYSTYNIRSKLTKDFVHFCLNMNKSRHESNLFDYADEINNAVDKIVKQTTHQAFSLVQDPWEWDDLRASASHFAVVSENNPTVCTFDRDGRQALDGVIDQRQGATDHVSVKDEGKM